MTYRAVVITISDKGSKGERVDTSGPRLKEMLARLYDVGEVLIVPDEADLIADTIRREIDENGVGPGGHHRGHRRGSP